MCWSAAGSVAWDDRDPSRAPSQETIDAVLLAQDLQILLLDTVGVLGAGLGGINWSWAAVVKGRREKEWKILKHEPEKSFGGQHTGDS